MNYLPRLSRIAAPRTDADHGANPRSADQQQKQTVHPARHRPAAHKDRPTTGCTAAAPNTNPATARTPCAALRARSAPAPTDGHRPSGTVNNTAAARSATAMPSYFARKPGYMASSSANCTVSLLHTVQGEAWIYLWRCLPEY